MRYNLDIALHSDPFCLYIKSIAFQAEEAGAPQLTAQVYVSRQVVADGQAPWSQARHQASSAGPSVHLHAQSEVAHCT